LGEIVDFPFPSRRAMIALAALPLDAPPDNWPAAELGGAGMIAAALVTDRVDRLPTEFADPAAAWERLSPALRAIVAERNPEMASRCEIEARR